MRIPRAKGLTVPQIAVVTALGIISGIYIYRPLFVGPDRLKPTTDKGEN